MTFQDLSLLDIAIAASLIMVNGVFSLQRLGLVDGLATSGRGSRGYRGQLLDSIGASWADAWLIMNVGLFAVIRVHP